MASRFRFGLDSSHRGSLHAAHTEPPEHSLDMLLPASVQEPKQSTRTNWSGGCKARTSTHSTTTAARTSGGMSGWAFRNASARNARNE
jgi:hypothetical protein